MTISGQEKYKIKRLFRERNRESDYMLTEKCEFKLRSCSANEWSRVLPGRANNRDTFIFNSEYGKASLDTPAAPWGINGIPCQTPLIESYEQTQFGISETKIVSDAQRYPCLSMTGIHLPTPNFYFLDAYTLAAKQLAPVLGIHGTWDEPDLRKNDLRWQESKIEYDMLNRIPGRILLPVKDSDGCIRHLIEIKQNPNMVLPLSFAQSENYSVPMPCNFTFDPAWDLINSEYLSDFPSADVVITNELGVVLGNKPDYWTVILGYAFGYEMIPYLKLEGLRYRKNTLLVIESPNKAEFRENLKEAINLLSRFIKLDIPVKIEYAKQHPQDTWKACMQKCDISGKEVKLEFLDEDYDVPLRISNDELVKMAMEQQIDIPDNIRLDRLGRIPGCRQTPIIENMLDSGSTTAIIAHDGVDVSRICGSIVAGILGHTGNVFPDHWKIMPGCCPVVLTAAGSQTGIERTLAGLHAKTCNLYTLPAGTKVEIKQRLSAIRHETKANVYIFSGSKILAEQKKLLEIASGWSQKSGDGMMICCNVKSSTGASDFLDETCARKIHIFRLHSNDLAYLVKEDDPFAENPQMFKIVFKQGSWTTEEPTEQDKQQAMDAMPVNQDYGEQKVYQENATENELKNLI